MRPRYAARHGNPARALIGRATHHASPPRQNSKDITT